MAEYQPPPEVDAPAEVEFQEEVSPPPAPTRPRRGSREYPMPPPPPRERISVGEREYEVDPGVAAYVRQMEQNYSRIEQIERHAQEQAAWRDSVQRAVVGEQPPAQDEIDALWFTNPSEARRRTKEEAKAEIRQEWQAERAYTTFWSTFDSEYPELAPQRQLVHFLSQTDQRLRALPNTPENRAELAKTAREWMLHVMQGARQSGTAPARQAVPPVETGTRRRSAPTPRQEPAGPQTMTEFRRQRRDQRRQHQLRLVQGGN